MVLPPGYDPGSSDFQSVAMTTSAKAGKSLFINICMNPYCSELSFNFDPVIDTDVVFQQQVSLQKIDLKYINPELVTLLDSVGLKIYYMECFRREPRNFSDIHVDHYGEDEFVKINWIYGGNRSRMIWYQPKDNAVGELRNTSAKTPYMFYKLTEVDQVAEIITENKPYLIQAGKPHRIVNPLEVRYCVCCLLSNANGELTPMRAAQEKLASYIVNGAG